MTSLLLLSLLSFPVGHRVELSDQQIQELNLPETVDNTYQLYSFDEAKKLKEKEVRLDYLEELTTLQTKKLLGFTDIVSSLTYQLEERSRIETILLEQTERRIDLLEENAGKEESSFPTIALSIGGTTFVVGSVLIFLALY